LELAVGVHDFSDLGQPFLSQAQVEDAKKRLKKQNDKARCGNSKKSTSPAGYVESLRYGHDSLIPLSFAC